MRTPLAWRNVTHRMVNTVASTTGVAFAIMLLFMQLGFYDVCFRSSTMLYDLYDFDIVLTSPSYVHMRAGMNISRKELVRALSCPGVKQAIPLYQFTGVWRTPQTWIQKEIVVMGVEPSNPGFRLPEMQRSAHHLSRLGTALGDVRCQRSYGDIKKGLITEVSGRQVEIVDVYDYGSGFVADGAMVVGEGTLAQLTPGHQRDRPGVGLLQLSPGTNVDAVVTALRAQLGPGVRVWPRDEMEANEQRFFVRLRPIGLMFFSGVLLALAVGAMILYQILSTEVMNCIKQYATLRAMGYGAGFLVKVVVQQAVILSILGYIPAVIAAEGIYVVTRWVSYLPMAMTWERRFQVLGMTLVFCVGSGLLVGYKALRADPAELF